MKSTKKVIITLLSLFVILFMSSGYSQDKVVGGIVANYAGNWDISFYDVSGKLLGNKAITISEDGSFSGNTNLSIDNVVYQEEISGKVSENGMIMDGALTNADRPENKGKFDGKFDEMKGTGNWSNYYSGSGTWTAEKN